MLKNYWKNALRYMGRHKTYSFINIAGLSVGLAVSLRDRHPAIQLQFHADKSPRLALCDAGRAPFEIPR
jgi:hypothetical protein